MRLIDADELTRQKQLEAMGNGQYEEVEIVYGTDIDNAPSISIDQRELCEDINCEDCPFMQGTCKLLDTYLCKLLNTYGERREE